MTTQFARKKRGAYLPMVALILTLAGLGASAIAQTNSNGISVGRPKVFDSRSLQIMLEELNRQLETVKAVDQEKLVAALGMQQGAESSDVRRSFELKAGGLPGTTTEEAPNTDGVLKVTKRSTTETAVTPAVPGLPELEAAPTFAPSFGQNAVDVLSDQVSLSYQIFNTRMLLERSLTDRVWGEGADAKPRLQAVLSFQVSLDPPKEMRDHAAYVEVTVTPTCAGQGEVSLVAMMPFEKTYNTSALRRRANAFGGSAVARVVTLGYAQTNRQQQFYLYRDADTLALETLNDPQVESTTFGWVFRPVLGRRAVTPGLRQMLAVVALPQADEGVGMGEVKVQVRTYWRKYRRNRLTTEREEKLEVAWSKAASVRVFTTSQVDDSLRPVVTGVVLSSTDATNSVASLLGKNFFPGTKIFLGNKVYSDTASGLTIKSDRTLELRVPTRELAFSNAVVSGRYGAPGAVGDANVSKVNILGIYGGAANDVGTREFVVLLARAPLPNSVVADSPLMTVGDNIVLPGSITTTECSSEEKELAGEPCLRLATRVSTPLLANDVLIGVRYPFRGPGWAASQWWLPSSFVVPKLVFLGEHDKNVRMVITGIFDDLVEVRVGETYPLEPKSEVLKVDGNYLTLTLPKASVVGMKRIVLAFNEDGDRFLRFVDLEEPPAPAVKPSLDKHEPQPAMRGSAGSVEFPGKALDKIKTAWSEGKELRVVSKKDGSAITVFLTRAVTKEVGPVKILLESQDGTLLPADVVVKP